MSWAAAAVLTFSSADSPVTIAGPGDINGDGYDDIAIGSPYWDDGPAWPNTGRVFIYAGSASGPSLTPTWTITGEQAEQFGFSIDFVGDTNADGFDDLLIGAGGLGDGGGGATLYLGDSVTPSVGRTWFSGDGTGRALSYAGDVDGNGKDDILLGHPYTYTDVFALAVGAAGLYYSPPEEGFVYLPGEYTQQYFGQFVDGADVNGDGYSDIFVGSDPYYTSYDPIQILYGSANGAGSPVDFDIGFQVDMMDTADVDGDGYADLLALQYENIWIYRGTPAGISPTSQFSWQVGSADVLANAGDYNGDGFDDILVTDTSAGPTFLGQTYLYAGGADGPQSNHRIVLEDPTASGFGRAARGIGDCNGDGYGDFAIISGSNSKVFIYLGGPDGDGDGSPPDEDCDDADPNVQEPTELFVDSDGDGFGATSWGIGCPTPSNVPQSGDCDDLDSLVNPAAEEIPGDGLDVNCDGSEICYMDGDGDGFRTGTTQISDDIDCDDETEAWSATPSGDCDDDDSNAFPGATEIAGDSIDQDCDGSDLDLSEETGSDDTGTGETDAVETESGDSTEGDTAISREGGCGCTSSGMTFTPWLGSLVLLALGRRRYR